MPGRCSPTPSAPPTSAAVITQNTVAVIGGGASGTLAAAHLARVARRRGTRLQLLLIDPAPVGQGVAYSTTDPQHRLNVPAKNMTAWPEDPDHFLRWVHEHVSADFPADGFVARMHYRDYLAHVLDDAVRTAQGVQLTHVRARATDLRRHGRRLRVTFDDGTSRPIDAAVLATGHDAPSTSWAPAALSRSARFVADPWAGAREPSVPAGGQVLLVGAGLTMADMAMRWGRAGVRVHVTSRHGMLPLPHADEASACALPAALPEGPLSLSSARRLVFSHIRTTGDWRAAIDGLRPVTSDLWQRLDDAGREAFLRIGARRWDRARHRVDPAIHAWLEQRRTDGALETHRGGVVAAVETESGLDVTLGDGTRVHVDTVVNCTGADGSVRTNADPLVMNLLESGLARPGMLDLGFATDTAGRLAAAGATPAAIWAIGPLRRGQLWESTAIPEIRSQAADLAQSVVAALPSPKLVRRARDPYGLPLSANSAAAAHYVEAVGRMLRVQSGADQLVAAAVRADPSFALGHAVQALLGVEWGADVDVAASVEAAQRAASSADERERRFVDVAIARASDPGPESAAALIAYIHSYPEDALAVSLAVPTIAFGGATEMPAEAWALVEGLEPSYGDDWWYRSLLAFVRQEQNRFEEAAELAAAALAIEPASGHAVHARTHVHYETGDHAAGLAWLDQWISTCGAQASHRAHFSWHAALHELALGDDRAAARRYAVQLAPPTVTGMRAMVDSASLLWRGYTVGAWGAVALDGVLDTIPRALLIEPPTPFAALHAAVALAAAGDCKGLIALRRHAADREDEVFTNTVAPLADALLDLVHDDPARATDTLLALPGIDHLGGSAAQREIVEDTLIHCATRAGRVELAADLLAARLDRRTSPRDSQRRAALVRAESVRVD